MKAVLDTNVLVAGVLKSYGTCGQILDLLVEGAFESVADDRILGEYYTVLHRPEFAISPQDLATILDLIHSTSHFEPARPLPVTLPDASDLPFLEVAASADAVLVTGNGRHFPIRERAGVQVLTPGEFLALFRRARSEKEPPAPSP